MRKQALLFLAILAGLFLRAQEKNASYIKWDKLVYDLGTIEADRPVGITFTFKNKGSEPIILSDVRPSCGCVTPSFTKEPVMPGKTGVVRLTFNAALPGDFKKSATVSYTIGTQPFETAELTIMGRVGEQ